jgi:(p)ppGpp synthase/HD superfamily hydrolase
MLTARFFAALSCTQDWHRMQTRKGSSTPYIAHSLSVTALVLEAGGTEDDAIAALLYDAIEDQGESVVARIILEKFGPALLAVVREYSDWDGDGAKPSWRQCKEEFVASIAEISASGRLVASADKLHNARDLREDYRVLGQDIWCQFNGGLADTLWYYRAVTDALQQVSVPKRIVEELLRVVMELEALVATEQKT